jgi:putative membrane protein
MTLVDAAILGQRAGRFGGHRPHWMGLVFMSLLVALVIAGIVALIVWISRTRHPAHSLAAAPAPPVPVGPAATSAPTPGDARRILDERLARGEIEPDDYRARREALES